MAEKLSWTELRRLLATRAGVSEKTAGLFLNALTAQLMEGLRSDKQVKINGLGTFKLQPVAPRKSVNVSTGEEITIEGYNKVVFSPEAGVKEMVDKQSPVGSQPAMVDPLKKLGEQATEIVDLLADLGQTPQTEKKKRAPKPVEEEPVAEEPIVEEPVVEEPVVEEPIVEEPIVEEPAPVAPIKPEPIEPVKPVEPVKPAEPAEPEKPKQPKKKKYHFVRDLLICVLVLLLLLAGCYFFLRNRLSGWIESLLEPQQTEQVEPVVADTIVAEEPEVSAVDLIPEGDIPQQQILDEFLAISEGLELEEEEERPYSDLITTEEMHEGSRLTWMAKRFYGDKKYWPYLYDANRDHIVNPSNIDVGTPIRVPRLTAEQLDTTIESTRINLERLRIEAEEACKK